MAWTYVISKNGGIHMGKTKKVKVVVSFTDGWEERIARASYDLYMRLKKFDQPEKAS